MRDRIAVAVATAAAAADRQYELTLSIHHGSVAEWLARWT